MRFKWRLINIGDKTNSYFLLNFRKCVAFEHMQSMFEQIADMSYSRIVCEFVAFLFCIDIYFNVFSDILFNGAIFLKPFNSSEI